MFITKNIKNQYLKKNHTHYTKRQKGEKQYENNNNTKKPENRKPKTEKQDQHRFNMKKKLKILH